MLASSCRSQAETSSGASWRTLSVCWIASQPDSSAEREARTGSAVAPRRVEQRHAELDRAADRPDRLRVVDVAPAVDAVLASERAADRPAAEAHRADRDPGASEGALQPDRRLWHLCLPFVLADKLSLGEIF